MAIDLIPLLRWQFDMAWTLPDHWLDGLSDDECLREPSPTPPPG